MAKKTPADDRRARVEELRKQQEGAERRRTMLVVGAAVSVIVILAGVVTAVVLQQVAAQDPANIGVASGAAACDTVITDAAPESGQAPHVGPGTEKPDVVDVKYAEVPPSHGEHYAQWIYPASPVYTASDTPKLEQLVHNLEHGYTILWYTKDLPKEQSDQLENLARAIRKNPAVGGYKFTAAYWDGSRGAFPAGKSVALTHWSAKEGRRQFCGALSGEAVKTFVETYPYSDSPEPNAQ